MRPDTKIAIVIKNAGLPDDDFELEASAKDVCIAFTKYILEARMPKRIDIAIARTLDEARAKLTSGRLSKNEDIVDTIANMMNSITFDD